MAARREGNDALLVALGVEDPEPACLQVEVSEFELHQFRAANARVEQGHQDGVIPDPDRCRQIAAREQPSHFIK